MQKTTTVRREVREFPASQKLHRGDDVVENDIKESSTEWEIE